MFRLTALATSVTAACGLAGLVRDVPTSASADPGVQDASWWRTALPGQISAPGTAATSSARPSAPSTTAAPTTPTTSRPTQSSPPAPTSSSPRTTTAPKTTTPPTTAAPPAATTSTPRSTPTATSSAAPSTATATGGAGTAPTGDLAGWRQVFSDDFTGSSLGARWRPYSGQPGGSPYGTWSPSQVQVGGGYLNLRNGLQNGQWVSGGLASTVSQTYGKWEMRFRIDASDEIKYAALLWPDGPSWPPEIDFAEDAGGNRSGTTATLHYGSDNAMVGEQVRTDLTQWHTMGVEWSPGRVVYTLDGQPWAASQHPGVPAEPMHLAIQTQPGGCQGSGGNFGCGVGNPATTSMQVDWVTVYAPA